MLKTTKKSCQTSQQLFQHDLVIARGFKNSTYIHECTLNIRFNANLKPIKKVKETGIQKLFSYSNRALVWPSS